MTEMTAYRHICGYPLEKGSELTRCPGCGGRITPWDVKAATGTFPSDRRAPDPLKVLMRWLVQEHPEIAGALAERLRVAVPQEPDETAALAPAERDVLQSAYRALQDARTGPQDGG